MTDSKILLKKYEFKKVHEKAPKLTKAIKLLILESLVFYIKAAQNAKEDFINSPGDEPKNFELQLARLTAYERAILAFGYTVEERKDGGQHDKQKNKKGHECKRSTRTI